MLHNLLLKISNKAMKRIKSIILAVTALVLVACGGSSSKGSIAGAGATFPLPFYNLLFKSYQDTTSVVVTYGGIGSGGGIRSLKDKVVDIAGTDAFLSDKEMKDMPAEVIHIPTCMGAVVLAYNLPSVETLNLSGEIIADIFLGKITKWNDSLIVAMNSGVVLPDSKINPVYRSDGSGTTYVFSDYMSKVSDVWAEQMGTAKALKWPVGIAAKGNPGVAGTIKQTEGSLGYVGSEYGFSLKIPMATLKNSSGNLISPTTSSISAAASGDLPKDTRAMITNSSAADAYPISCFTWLLIYKEQAYNNKTIEQARLNVELLKWMLSDSSQDMTEIVHYAPLPKVAIDNALKSLEGVTYNGVKL